MGQIIGLTTHDCTLGSPCVSNCIVLPLSRYLNSISYYALWSFICVRVWDDESGFVKNCVGQRAFFTTGLLWALLWLACVVNLQKGTVYQALAGTLRNGLTWAPGLGFLEAHISMFCFRYRVIFLYLCNSHSRTDPLLSPSTDPGISKPLGTQIRVNKPL